MQDRSNDKIHKDQQDQMNAFSVTPLPLRKDLPKIPGTFHSIREFLNFVDEQNIEVTFHNGNVRKALNGKYTQTCGYKFTYVNKSIDPLVT